MVETKRTARMPRQIPTYYITDTYQEDAGGGNVRIANYERIGGVLVLQFYVVIAAAPLMLIGHRVADLAQAVFNSDQLRTPGAKVH
jgi:hypothetical protein